MEEKSYEQMGIEFNYFYKEQVKPLLPSYERKRKEAAYKRIVFRILALVLIAFAIIMSLRIKDIDGAYLVIICLSLLFSFIFIIRNAKRSLTGEAGVKTDLEMDLKKRLMLPFLNIFSTQADWEKDVSIDDSDYYLSTNIFNSFPYALTDDSIKLTFKGVEIQIDEINTANLPDVAFGCGAGCLMASPLFLMPSFIVICLLVVLSFSADPGQKFTGIMSLSIIAAIIFTIAIFLIKKLIKYKGYRGAVIELTMNKHFKGHTFFVEKSMASKKIDIDRRKYEAIKLESVDFMNKYDVYSTDQIEARYILTTSMIDRLQNLKLAFKANYIRGSFKNDKLILAIDVGRDMFAMGSDFKESNYRVFNELYNEIISILKIVDQLKLNEKAEL